MTVYSQSPDFCIDFRGLVYMQILNSITKFTAFITLEMIGFMTYIACILA